MSAAQAIRAATAARAEQLGINPTVAIGIIEELSQYGTLVRGGRIGVFGAPIGILTEGETPPSKWQDQLELGLTTFAKLKETAGVDDIPALVSYIGGPDAQNRALRALERGAKHTGEQFDTAEMRKAIAAMRLPSAPLERDAPDPASVGRPVLDSTAQRAEREETLSARLSAAFGDTEGEDAPKVPAHISRLIEAYTDE